MQPISLFVAIAFLAPMVCIGQDQKNADIKPPAPPEEITPAGSHSTTLTVRTYSSGAPFNPAIHKGIYTDWPLLQQEYLNVLRSQVLNQDVWHQAESKAHFDNCDFEGSTRYIRELMAEVEAWANRASRSREVGDSDSEKREITEAYIRIGRLLHGVQDFYAHTNYVEILVEKVNRKEITPGDFYSGTVPMWHEGIDEQIEELQTQGLVSGAVWWGFPKRCKAGSPSHGDLAKDSNKGNGAKNVPELANQTLHKLALELAGKASVQFIEFAWEEWPVLELGKPKDSFPLEVFVDRRDHE